MAVRVSTGYAEALLGGQSFASIFQDGVMELYSGSQPGSADDPPTGTLLARITRDGGAWVAGAPTNGLRFVSGGRQVTKDPGHIWQLRGEASGSAGWMRLLPNTEDDALYSLTNPRIDGAVGTLAALGDFQFYLTNTGIIPATNVIVTGWWFALPPIGE